MPLNYNNSTPLYVQLKEKIEQKIIDGEYTSKIPSEREIMDDFFVSRSTVREAVNELVRDNILTKVPGKGTFVTLKSIEDWLGNLSSTTETIQRMGMEAGAKLITASIVKTPKELLKTIEDKRVFRIKRIRYANYIPIGVEDSYYPIDIGQQMKEFGLDNVPLYDLIEKELKIHTQEAEQVISADVISERHAELLQLPTTATVLHVERKLYDNDNRFIELEKAVYRADMYSFRINLARKFH